MAPFKALPDVGGRVLVHHATINPPFLVRILIAVFVRSVGPMACLKRCSTSIRVVVLEKKGPIENGEQ